MRCDQCKWWCQDVISLVAGMDDYGESICRRYPPTRNRSDSDEDDSSRWSMPWTVEDDWCGEFTPASSPDQSQTSGSTPTTT